jgi:hypothetical protein
MEKAPSAGLTEQGLVPPPALTRAQAQELSLALTSEELAPGHSAAQDWNLNDIVTILAEDATAQLAVNGVPC